jgi:hypothetical protein
MSYCHVTVAFAKLKIEGELANSISAMRYTFSSLVCRLPTIIEKLEIHLCHVKRLTQESDPSLFDALDIRPDAADQLFIAVGDDSKGIRSNSLFGDPMSLC